MLVVVSLPGHSAKFGDFQQFDRNTPLAKFLQDDGRARHAAYLGRQTIDGKTFSWRQYAGWGKELVSKGCVQDPPSGAGPSQQLSKRYRCVHCHNFDREDPVPAKQDPSARAFLIRKETKHPEKRDGTTIGLTPATTLWGAVNRQQFYNGYYAKYHHLLVTGGSKMNPQKLCDAVQVCSRYCSCGRFAEPWELDSILTYLWDLEACLKDLNLPSAQEQQVLDAFNRGGNINDARNLLRRSYLLAAAAEKASFPSRTQGNSDVYSDGETVNGNAESGHFLYRAACAGCHGNEVNHKSGADLVTNNRRFHRLVLKGTEGDDIYMPLFTKQRLSRQQVADIRAYLRSLRR